MSAMYIASVSALRVSEMLYVDVLDVLNTFLLKVLVVGNYVHDQSLTQRRI